MKYGRHTPEVEGKLQTALRFLRLEQHQQAKPVLKQSLEAAEKAYGRYHPRLLVILLAQARCADAAGRLNTRFTRKVRKANLYINKSLAFATNSPNWSISNNYDLHKIRYDSASTVPTKLHGHAVCSRATILKQNMEKTSPCLPKLPKSQPTKNKKTCHRCRQQHLLWQYPLQQ